MAADGHTSGETGWPTRRSNALHAVPLDKQTFCRDGRSILGQLHGDLYREAATRTTPHSRTVLPAKLATEISHCETSSCNARRKSDGDIHVDCGWDCSDSCRS